MITQDSIQFGTTTINYDIIYSSKRKNATLSVYPIKHVEISVPSHIDKEHIQQLVKKKAGWVLKQMLWFDEITQIDSQKEHVNGETFLYLGRQYRLKIIQSNEKTEAKLKGKYLCMNLPENILKDKEKKIIQATLWAWYKKRARKK
ncbi:MAG: DUF45 domain-containing protein, partial [Candidatus Aenigmarchaeota archaeon]|nr:DUF45 domain-containing protein [Candidatus Aenigmarchaeota archaeon]